MQVLDDVLIMVHQINSDRVAKISEYDRLKCNSDTKQNLMLVYLPAIVGSPYQIIDRDMDAMFEMFIVKSHNTESRIMGCFNDLTIAKKAKGLLVEIHELEQRMNDAKVKVDQILAEIQSMHSITL